MAKQQKAEQVQESIVPEVIEAFTEEQLQLLPKETQESIVYLTERLPSKELLVLNPLVSSLIKIEELKETVKYDADNEKESIAVYKSAKDEIKDFIKKVAETKKAIKGPLDAMGKEVLNIEKSVTAIAQGVSEALALEFKVFEDAETERKKAAKEKRDAKANEAVAELANTNAEHNKTITKTNFLNLVKYTALEPWEAKVNEAVDNYSRDALLGLKNDLALINSDELNKSAAEHIANEVLTQDEYNIAIGIYQTKLTGLQKRIDDKIELHNTKEEIKATQDQGEGAKNAMATFAGFGIGAPVAGVPVQSPPAGEVLETSPEETNTALQEMLSFIPVMRYENGAVAIIDQKKELETRLSQMKLEYTNIFNEAKKTVTTKEELEALKKISGACVLFGKIIDYLDGTTIPQANNNQQ